MKIEFSKKLTFIKGTIVQIKEVFFKILLILNCMDFPRSMWFIRIIDFQNSFINFKRILKHETLQNSDVFQGNKIFLSVPFTRQ